MDERRLHYEQIQKTKEEEEEKAQDALTPYKHRQYNCIDRPLHSAVEFIRHHVIHQQFQTSEVVFVVVADVIVI